MLHDYLHCLVFKEQSFHRLSFQATCLSYHQQTSLSRTFLKFFQGFLELISGLPIKACCAVSCPCLSATCNILHEFYAYVNTFFEKNAKKIPQAREMLYDNRITPGCTIFQAPRCWRKCAGSFTWTCRNDPVS